mmetsp:Transcript_56771/g.123451  ORF Transcript_56771/g.123451 Transcript_56771/m.123451 type:complete len:350 (-) Transcript_56771:548-1597(-)
MASELKLIFACSGIFFSFSYFAVLQEDVYKKEYGGERFEYTLFALAVERGVNALIALLGIGALGGSGIRIPHFDIFNSGISQMLAMAGSNEALRYVSYPTQVLGKSCKMLPVMVGGIVLGGKVFTVFQYLQVILVTLGVTVFNFGGKKKGGGADSLYGLGLIGFSLVMDAVTGGLQEKVKKRSKELNPGTPSAKPTMHESMFWTNISGCLVAAVLGLFSGHLIGGFNFSMRHPQVLSAVLIYSLASAVGQNFIYYTITQFNPLLLSTVTTTRKIFSTVYSVLRNPSNKLDALQWGGCALVFVGLFLEVGEKYMHTAPKKDGAKKSDAAIDAAKESPATNGRPKRTQKAD